MPLAAQAEAGAEKLQEREGEYNAEVLTRLLQAAEECADEMMSSADDYRFEEQGGLNEKDTDSIF